LPAQCSGELVLLGPIDASLLAVASWRKSEGDEGAIGEVLDWNEVALPLLRTVRGDCVDVRGGVTASNETVRASPARPARDKDDSTLLRRPLALNTDESEPQVEDQVISLVADRPRHTDAQLDGRMRDGRFGDHALLVGREHDRILVS
jgi:hypothetical protein